MLAEELNLGMVGGECGDGGGLLSRDGEDEDEDVDTDDVVEEMNVDSQESVDIGHEVLEKAFSLKERVVSFESTSKIVGLANEIRELRAGKGGECVVVLGLIEPWLADDETLRLLRFYFLIWQVEVRKCLLGQARFCARSSCPSYWFLRSQPRVC